jgi:hypothetical protein
MVSAVPVSVQVVPVPVQATATQLLRIGILNEVQVILLIYFDGT